MKPSKTSPPPRNSSTGVKVLIGCGIAGFLGLVVACGGIFLVVRWGIGQFDKFGAEFEQKGYARRMGQVFKVNDHVEKPTVYTCQVLEFKGQSDSHIAVMCQVAKIEGTINGDIDFQGQVLTIENGAVVEGNIRVRGAQVVDIKGEVKGKVTGSWQVIKRSNTAKSKQPKSKPNDATEDTEGTSAGHQTDLEST